MTVSALFGVAAALGLVLAALGLAMRLLNRFARPQLRGPSALPVDVVARIGLGPRQGLAVVRVGERGVVVAVGEGGVRPVLELNEAECAMLREPEGPAPSGAGRAIWPAALRGRVRRALRTTLLVACIAAPAMTVPAREAVAQTAAQTTAAAPAAAAGAGVPVDSVAAALLPRLGVQIGDEETGLRLSGTVGTVVVLGLLTLLPTLLLLMTSFTRILVVLHFLRQALGTQSAPPGHLLAALALLLTGFVMAPTMREVNRVALHPWVEGRIVESEMLRAAVVPMREFMLRQTSEEDLGTFLEMSGSPTLAGPEEVPLVVLVSAFAIGELRKAFQIGFAIYLPFVVIDLVVAAVLTSMGMFMLPPTMVALPLKLMLFVLVDGWSLVVQSLAAGFH